MLLGPLANRREVAGAFLWGLRATAAGSMDAPLLPHSAFTAATHRWPARAICCHRCHMPARSASQGLETSLIRPPKPGFAPCQGRLGGCGRSPSTSEKGDRMGNYDTAIASICSQALVALPLAALPPCRPTRPLVPRLCITRPNFRPPQDASIAPVRRAPGPPRAGRAIPATDTRWQSKIRDHVAPF